MLKATLINLSGHPGAFTSADVMQEFFNRLLEAIVEKKEVKYGDTFVRDVISCNLHHFARIKITFGQGWNSANIVADIQYHMLTLKFRLCFKFIMTVNFTIDNLAVYTDKDDFQKGVL